MAIRTAPTDISVMSDDEIRTALRNALAARSIDPTALSKGIGRGKDYVRDFLSGRKQSMKPADVNAIEKRLGVRLTVEDRSELPKITPNASPPKQLVNNQLTPPLRRYSSAYAGSGGTIVMNEIFEEVPCPPKLAGVEGAYACYIHGDSMEPALSSGDTVYCHPFHPKRRNDLVVVQILADGNPDGPIVGLVKRFLSEDPEKVTVCQFNPPETFVFERKRVKAIHKVEYIEKP